MKDFKVQLRQDSDEETFYCNDCGGIITLQDGFWTCSDCDFEEENEESEYEGF